ncbi:hypothetical protein QA601_15440 [Chitinispirillales bacterium ANBcel5]|uniref:hypothetical protein n=1 Tax=Cellulosispirillum alkaliphilum TaxID=3039283 RepID=UPI002A518B47|nr:hypothetical protein [Chitinispirillales bacterium ANBcel5]
MKRILLSLIFILAVSLSIKAQQPTYEIGVILGQPTGLSGKYWAGERTAFDAGASWSFSDASFELYADILYHYSFIDMDEGVIPLYVGAGAVTFLRDDFAIGARFPFGLSYLFDDIPVSLFAEIAPIVEIIPETGFTLNGGVGARFTF